MNTKTFGAGVKTLNATLDASGVAIDAIKYIPSAFCELGNMVRSDVSNVTESVTSFFAGMRHAARVRSGKCKLIGSMNSETK